MMYVCPYYNLMKTNRSSGDYTAIFHSQSAYIMTHEMTAYEIFLCRHIVQIYSLRSLGTVKCHPKFNLVEGVLSQGVVVHAISRSAQLLSITERH